MSQLKHRDMPLFYQYTHSSQESEEGSPTSQATQSRKYKSKMESETKHRKKMACNLLMMTEQRSH